MRYSFNTYKDMAFEELQRRLGEENVELVTVPKNNGVMLQGVQLKMESGMACPVMYFNNVKEVFDEADVINFVREAERIFRETESFSVDAVKKIRDWGIAKDVLRAKVINYESNKEYLTDKPFVRFLDLAVLFQISTAGIVRECEDGMITVNNNMMKCWGVDVETIYKEALNNLEQSDYRVCSMSSMLNMMVFDSDGDLADETLCVATTYEGYCGASVILSNSILHKASELMKCDRFYILPSSIHEILLIDCTKAELKDLQKMVEDVNDSIVEIQDILSNTVYIFENGCVKVA